MNYPLWDLPAPGLLIALVAVVHVFVSHFAVGGGLFLVVTETKARNEGDADLLDYVRRHSRFFVLLTLVFGAVTGVGIWFTIALVHPAATSSLINIFVWGWAIEWTFFLTEIAAALVYYYGWDRLTVRQHLAVGWIYFGAAWASMIVINGILTFMLTLGAWIDTRSFLDAFFNPTYWPSLLIRTLGAMGLAGIYALFTASWISPPELKKKLARYAVKFWVLPLAFGLPVGLLWFFSSASKAGVPVAEVLGAKSASAFDLFASIFNTAGTGNPVTHRALVVAFAAITFTILAVIAATLFRYGRVLTALVMLGGLLSIGGAEWVREDLRKPYVIGSYMLVNGIHTTEDLSQTGVLAGTRYRLHADAGHELFRLQCSQCHTERGYLGMQRLAGGKSSRALEGVIARLDTWRNRRMPPFKGNAEERRALAVYLATLGGGKIDPPPSPVSAAGAQVFDAHCAACHGPGSEWPIATRVATKSEAEIYELLGDLPARNEMMPPFEGSEEERRALAGYLSASAVTR